MTVSERIPFSGLLLPLQEGYTYNCDRRTTDGMELLFIFREDGHSRTLSRIWKNLTEKRQATATL